MSQPEPLTEQQLDEYAGRATTASPGSWGIYEYGADGSVTDITAEVRRLRDKTAQAPARRDAQVMRRCAAFVCDTYSGEWADDAAATLERDADVTEHGCPGYEDAGRGDTVAERQLANCKNCGRPRAVCQAAPEPALAPAPRRTLTPNEYSAAWHAVEGAAGEEGADPGTVLHAVLNRLGIDTPAAEEAGA